jgi:hypothetical protein
MSQTPMGPPIRNHKKIQIYSHIVIFINKFLLIALNIIDCNNKLLLM